MARGWKGAREAWEHQWPSTRGRFITIVVTVVIMGIVLYVGASLGLIE